MSLFVRWPPSLSKQNGDNHQYYFWSNFAIIFLKALSVVFLSPSWVQIWLSFGHTKFLRTTVSSISIVHPNCSILLPLVTHFPVFIPLSAEEDPCSRRKQVSNFGFTHLQLFWQMHRHKKIKLVLILTLSFINIECSVFNHRTMLFLSFLFEVLLNMSKCM